MEDYSNNSIEFLEKKVLETEKKIFSLRLKMKGLGSENLIFVNPNSKLEGDGSFEKPYNSLDKALQEQKETSKSIYINGRQREETLAERFIEFRESQEKVEVNGKTQYMVKGQTCTITESELFSLFIKQNSGQKP